MQEAPSFVNVANVCFVTFIIQHYRIQGAFLLCKITNLLIYSFQEKVEQEIKKNVKAGLSYAKYNIQSKKLTIKNLVYSKTDLWGEYEICLDNEKYKAVLRALTFFDSGKKQFNIYDGWLERFVSFSYIGKKEKEGIFDEHLALGKKVVKFKYFKNGRWDIVFDSGVHALSFAKEYLGYKEVI